MRGIDPASIYSTYWRDCANHSLNLASSNYIRFHHWLSFRESANDRRRPLGERQSSQWHSCSTSVYRLIDRSIKGIYGVTIRYANVSLVCPITLNIIQAASKRHDMLSRGIRDLNGVCRPDCLVRAGQYLLDAWSSKKYFLSTQGKIFHAVSIRSKG